MSSIADLKITRPYPTSDWISTALRVHHAPADVQHDSLRCIRRAERRLQHIEVLTVLHDPRCHGLYISNGDLVRLGGWVFYASAASPQPHCGRVDEILLRETNSAPLGMLVCKSDISQTATLPYRFPAVTPREGDYEFISVQVRLGNRHTAL